MTFVFSRFSVVFRHVIFFSLSMKARNNSDSVISNQPKSTNNRHLASPASTNEGDTLTPTRHVYKSTKEELARWNNKNDSQQPSMESFSFFVFSRNFCAIKLTQSHWSPFSVHVSEKKATVYDETQPSITKRKIIRQFLSISKTSPSSRSASLDINKNPFSHISSCLFFLDSIRSSGSWMKK